MAWSCDGECAVWREVQCPASLVHKMMVPGTQWEHVSNVRQTAEVEPANVVNLTLVEWCLAQRARSVEHSQGTALGSVGESGFAPEQ